MGPQRQEEESSGLRQQEVGEGARGRGVGRLSGGSLRYLCCAARPGVKPCPMGHMAFGIVMVGGGIVVR